MTEKEYLHNMPETARNYFEAFLKDESWTLAGLVECIKRYSIEDLEELHLLIGEALEKN